jgi:hypothetical protein
MIWMRDEFGNLYQARHISKEAVGESDRASLCIHVNGQCASRPYPQDVIEETMSDISGKIREGVCFLDLEEIIRAVKSDLSAPLSDNMHPWPPQDNSREKLH